ncbi:reticulocyte-binding protein 2-like [Hydractinia symbiolongicarpus]|uniref:reticulocyte-binding protein 2-like n=1 Tax=Hydractinia symbiolongicarpus TaxID=13093 RepID=UPI0025519512|nr:reticulocyte-binding protein 2-like [Hydractinia symbiolongicarpus]
MTQEEIIADLDGINFTWDVPPENLQTLSGEDEDMQAHNSSVAPASASAIRSRRSTSHNPFVMDDEEDSELSIIDPFGSINSQPYDCEEKSEASQTQAQNIFAVVYDGRECEKSEPLTEGMNHPKALPRPPKSQPTYANDVMEKQYPEEHVEKQNDNTMKHRMSFILDDTKRAHEKETSKQSFSPSFLSNRPHQQEKRTSKEVAIDHNEKYFNKSKTVTRTSAVPLLKNATAVLTVGRTSSKSHVGTKCGSRNHGPKVFGKNYKYIKSHISHVRNNPSEEFRNGEDDEISNMSHKYKINSRFKVKERNDVTSPLRDEAGSTSYQREDDYYKKFLTLQQELKSSFRKISKLQQINKLALKRKDEMQREALAAYKKISDLEISENTNLSHNRELSAEIRNAKQRIGEAEMEASHAIGRTNKLERDLKNAADKRNRYYEELVTAEENINNLERNMREIKAESRSSEENANKLQQELAGKENEILRYENRNKELMELMEKNEGELAETLTRFDIVVKEKTKYEGQIEELTKANSCLKEDLQRLQTKYEISQRTVEQCTTRIKEQKEKFDSMIVSRLNIEKELREVHDELSKERVEKHSYSTQCTDLLTKLSEAKNSINQYKQETDLLQKENRGLKDRVLYLDLYKQMMGNKTKNSRLSKQNNNVNLSNKLLREDSAESLQSSESPTASTSNNINIFTQRLAKLQQDQDVLHKLAGEGNRSRNSSRNEGSLSLYGDSQLKNEETSQLSTKNEIDSDIFSIDGQESAFTSRSLSCDKDKDLLYDVEMKHDGDFPFELRKNLNRATIFPSFAASFQQEEHKETRFSDLIQANNKDIANALL